MSVSPVEIKVEDVVAAVQSVMRSRRGRQEEITADTQIEDLQLNSLDVAEIFLEIEESLECELDPHSMPEPVVVGDLAKLQPL
jgi:acyl carrier protein